jgi:hypothetical protein
MCTLILVRKGVSFVDDIINFLQKLLEFDVVFSMVVDDNLV